MRDFRTTLQKRLDLRNSNPPLTLWARQQIDALGLNAEKY
tara:strand:+ start:2044 stop:2163 length:120 start_codon:yes stop_codon:yes gene_type:complete